MGLTYDEAQIGERIRLARKEHGVSQRLAATQMGISRDQLNRIERGEVAVRFLPALLFCEFTNRSPLWLAFDDARNRFGFFWVPEPAEERMIQGGQYEVLQAITATAAIPPEDATASFMKVMRRDKDRYETFSFFGTSDKEPRWGLGTPRRIGALFLGDPECKQALTKPVASANVASVKLEKWPILREQILKIVQRRGMKSALADDIGVSRQALHALLSKQRADIPSAKYAKLSEWVQRAELSQKSQKQSAGTAANRTGAKTRERKQSHHEKKPNSDRKKK